MKYGVCFFVLWMSSFSLMYAGVPTLSAFGEMLVAESSTLIQLQFPYILHPDYIQTAVAGSGVVSYTRPFALLSTTAASNSAAILASRDRLHYQPGQGCATIFTARFTTGVANSTQLIGVGNFSSNTALTFANLQDGFFFGYSGATFGIFHRNNGVVTFIAQASWNVDPFDGSGASGVTLDPTNGNVYKIQYQWLGFGIINFFIEDPATGVLTLVHRIPRANANTLTSLFNPTLRLVAGVENTTNNTAIALRVSSFCGIIEGEQNIDNSVRFSVRSGVVATAVPNNSPTFNSILTIRNKSLFNGIANQVEVFPEFVSLMNSPTGPTCVFKVLLNPTFGGALAFTDVSTTRSVVDFSTTVTTIVGGTGTELFSFYLNSPATQLSNLYNFTVKLCPGDQLCIAASRIGGASTVLASLSWREFF